MSTLGDEHGHRASPGADQSSKTGHPGPAPAPVIHHGPPPPKDPHTWRAPEIHSDQGLEVHHDVLREVGAAMKGPDMYELDDALRQLRHSDQAPGSLPHWSTGAGLAGNAHSARDGFLDAGGQVGDAHFSAARKLMDSVEAYDDAEQRIKRKAHGVSASHDGHQSGHHDTHHDSHRGHHGG